MKVKIERKLKKMRTEMKEDLKGIGQESGKTALDIMLAALLVISSTALAKKGKKESDEIIKSCKRLKSSLILLKKLKTENVLTGKEFAKLVLTAIKSEKKIATTFLALAGTSLVGFIALSKSKDKIKDSYTGLKTTGNRIKMFSDEYIFSEDDDDDDDF